VIRAGPDSIEFFGGVAHRAPPDPRSFEAMLDDLLRIPVSQWEERMAARAAILAEYAAALARAEGK
jgi:hypothetical protein